METQKGGRACQGCTSEKGRAEACVKRGRGRSSEKTTEEKDKKRMKITSKSRLRRKAASHDQTKARIEPACGKIAGYHPHQQQMLR